MTHTNTTHGFTTPQVFDHFTPTAPPASSTALISYNGNATNGGNADVVVTGAPRPKPRSWKELADQGLFAQPSDPGCSSMVAATPTLKPKPKRKPDPDAPKITPPCSECGKRFASWKALFGHMRCHPNRPYRGINPPPGLVRPVSALEQPLQPTTRFSEDECNVASILLMLANGPAKADNHGDGVSLASSGTRFECSTCATMLGSYHALWRHRAGNKCGGKASVPTSSRGGGAAEIAGIGNGSGHEGVWNSKKRSWEEALELSSDHEYNVCYGGFSSGKALGMHKRCHWERVVVDEHVVGSYSSSRDCFWDLNLPPPLESYQGGASSQPSPVLDLKLGI